MGLSSLAVLVAAVITDVVADEPPLHTLAVALAATIVGAGRFRLRHHVRGRLQGVVVAVNLAVLSQPAVHALGELTHLGADALPHSHGVPESLSGIALHVVVALLVVAVAASELTCARVAPWARSALAHLRTLFVVGPVPVGPPLAARRRLNELSTLSPQLSTFRPVTRRGPPVAAGLAG